MKIKHIITILLTAFSFYILCAQSTTPPGKRSTKEIERLDSMYRAKHDSIILSKHGTAYPTFALVDLQGAPISEKQLIGKVTLINLWFESCAPCVAEMPALNELYLKYRDHPEFQLLSFAREHPEDAARCVRKFDMPYPVYPVSTAESYRLNFNNGFPTNIITDTHGKIVLIKSGSFTEPEKAKEGVRMLEEKIVNLFTISLFGR